MARERSLLVLPFEDSYVALFEQLRSASLKIEGIQYEQGRMTLSPERIADFGRSESVVEVELDLEELGAAAKECDLIPSDIRFAVMTFSRLLNLSCWGLEATVGPRFRIAPSAGASSFGRRGGSAAGSSQWFRHLGVDDSGSGDGEQAKTPRSLAASHHSRPRGVQLLIERRGPRPEDREVDRGGSGRQSATPHVPLLRVTD
jgi:hypothetical protein